MGQSIMVAWESSERSRANLSDRTFSCPEYTSIWAGLAPMPAAVHYELCYKSNQCCVRLYSSTKAQILSGDICPFTSYNPMAHVILLSHSFNFNYQ